MICFAYSKVLNRTNSMPQINLEQFLRCKSPLKFLAQNISRVNDPKLATLAIYKPPKVYKQDCSYIKIYQGKALNVPSMPLNLYRIVFGEKKILKIYKFSTISNIKCENFSRAKLIRSISYSLNSILNDFVAWDISPRINNLRSALSIVYKFFKPRIN